MSKMYQPFGCPAQGDVCGGCHSGCIDARLRGERRLCKGTKHDPLRQDKAAVGGACHRQPHTDPAKGTR